MPITVSVETGNYQGAVRGARLAGAGGTGFAATTRANGITTSARRVRTVQLVSLIATRSPSASVRPSDILYRTTTLVPREAPSRNCRGVGICEFTTSY